MSKLVRPPGPKSRGIVGNFPLGSGDPLGTYTRWAREYGDIFYYRSFHRHVYVLNNPDLIKTVLLTNYQNFVKGRVAKSNQRVLGNGLLTSEGDFWLGQRRLMQPAFHHSRIAGYGKVMVAYTERMMDGWRDGEALDIHHESMRLTMEIVAKTIFGVDLTTDVDRIFAAVETINNLAVRGRLLRPIVRFLPTPGNKRHERAVRELDDVVYGLIRSRRANDSQTDDLLSALVSMKDDDGVSMPEKQVRDEVLTLLLAGYETTALSLSWTFYLLAQNPVVEEKLLSELRLVLNGRSPTVEDYSKLTYTQAVVKEATRLYSPAWFVVRSPLQDCELGGFTVPAGSIVLMSPWLTHRDPRYYPEPERFDPDRWLDKEFAENLKMAYFPFGGGPRGCIGASFAAMETTLVLATIAQKFQVSLAPGFQTTPVPTLTLRPKDGIKVVLAKRGTS
jgi:cytochrome P450